MGYKRQASFSLSFRDQFSQAALMLEEQDHTGERLAPLSPFFTKAIFFYDNDDLLLMRFHHFTFIIFSGFSYCLFYIN